MMNPDPQTGGLFSFLNRMRKPNSATGLSPIQNFAQALDPLILPSMRGGEAIRAQGQQRVANNNRNRTIEFLKNAPNGEKFAEAIEAGVPLDQVYRAYIADQANDLVVVGKTVFNRKTMQPVFTDKGSGSGGSFSFSTPDGMEFNFTNMPDLNQDKGNAMAFGTRIQNANNILSEVDLAGTDFLQNMLNNAPFGLGRFYQSDNFRSYDDARRDFVNAVLRRESGAAIAESEFESANRQYFPVPGDSEQQIKEKRMRRALAARLMLGSAGQEGAEFGLRTLEDLQKSLNPLFGTDAYNEQRKNIDSSVSEDF